MLKTKFSVGIDISCDDFTVSILLSKGFKVIASDVFSNDQVGFDLFIKWLRKNKITKKNAYLTMETTGVYTEKLSYFLYEKKYKFSVASAIKVTKAFGQRININDLVASQKIAEYAIRYSDELIEWQPPSEILEQVKMLLSFREQLVKEKSAHKSRIHALNKKVINNEKIITTITDMIKKLEIIIEELETEIKGEFMKSEGLRKQAVIIDSVPGVGLLLAANLMVLTNAFQKTCNPKEIASYLGICPNEKRSGKSVFKKGRSTGWGPGKIRKLLFLAASSVKEHRESFKKYFLQKHLQGKNKHLIINNIANKLIKIICGIVKSGKPYQVNYFSINPNLVRKIA